MKRILMILVMIVAGCSCYNGRCDIDQPKEKTNHIDLSTDRGDEIKMGRRDAQTLYFIYSNDKAKLIKWEFAAPPEYNEDWVITRSDTVFITFPEKAKGIMTMYVCYKTDENGNWINGPEKNVQI